MPKQVCSNCIFSCFKITRMRPAVGLLNCQLKQARIDFKNRVLQIHNVLVSLWTLGVHIFWEFSYCSYNFMAATWDVCARDGMLLWMYIVQSCYASATVDLMVSHIVESSFVLSVCLLSPTGSFIKVHPSIELSFADMQHCWLFRC